ncbi:conjugal transfer protein TrbL, partial [Streptococcus suis]|nr:conjugal transfer protein TrbL [Streptococcus suis]
MNFTSPFVFLASEKVSSDSLFEGFQVDLESTANLIKSLAEFNPTVWSYMTAITKGIMQPLGVAILAVVLVLEFSKMAKKIANSGGANYDTISGIKGSGIVGKMIIGFFAILIWLVRMASIMVVNILITIRFIQLYLMIPFAPVTIPTFLSDDWRSVGIGYLKN